MSSEKVEVYIITIRDIQTGDIITVVKTDNYDIAMHIMDDKLPHIGTCEGIGEISIKIVEKKREEWIE